MEEFKQRLVKERVELRDKWAKLVMFMSSKKFDELEFEDKVLLRRQCFFMELYLETLVKRMERLGIKDETVS